VFFTLVFGSVRFSFPSKLNQAHPYTQPLGHAEYCDNM
jgi:hypothetical protein